MAEEKVVAREVSWRQLLPWTQLFRGFQVTLDLNKLLLAAAGIVVMAFGWWLLSWIFTLGEDKIQPAWPSNYIDSKVAAGDRVKAWGFFRKERQHWNLMHEATGMMDSSPTPPKYEIVDLAETLAEYHYFDPDDQGGKGMTSTEAIARIAELEKTEGIPPAEANRLRVKYARLGQVKPAGLLSISPWSEDRGPNPYLLVTGQAGIPWQAGSFWDWFTRDQVPVMIEPLVKFVRPIVYFLSPRNDIMSRVYFLCVTLWTLLTWSLFGGAITRIAVVEIARNESVGLVEALRFTLKRIGSYITAPLFPLVFVFVMLVLLAIFGLFFMIPVVGDVLVAGLFWPLALLAGLGMAVALVFLVSWPLMAATISAEGSDSWEAVSRAYGYVINRPWQCIWYSVVAIAYGAVIVFFVGFMASLMVYMAKWGVSQTPLIQTAGREPSFLFVYAPTSFGWRELLLEGATVQADADPDLKKWDGAEVVASRSARPIETHGVGGVSRHNRINSDAYNAYYKTLKWWNKLGALLVAFWLGLAFLGVIGFGYAYFWSASTLIYLLLRRSMDAAEMDEVYFEEEEYDSFRMPTPAPKPGPGPAAPAPAPAKPAQSLPVVEAPRPAPAPAAAPPSPPTASVAVEPKPAPAPTPAPTPAPKQAPLTMHAPVVVEKPPVVAPEPSLPEKSPPPAKPDEGGTPPVV